MNPAYLAIAAGILFCTPLQAQSKDERQRIEPAADSDAQFWAGDPASVERERRAAEQRIEERREREKARSKPGGLKMTRSYTLKVPTSGSQSRNRALDYANGLSGRRAADERRRAQDNDFNSRVTSPSGSASNLNSTSNDSEKQRAERSGTYSGSGGSSSGSDTPESAKPSMPEKQGSDKCAWKPGDAVVLEACSADDD